MALQLITVGSVIWLACCLDMRLLATLGISAFSMMCAGLLLAGLYSSPGRLLQSRSSIFWQVQLCHLCLPRSAIALDIVAETCCGPWPIHCHVCVLVLPGRMALLAPS